MIIWDCDYDDNTDRIISENYVALKRERKPKKEKERKKTASAVEVQKIVKSWQKYNYIHILYDI